MKSVGFKEWALVCEALERGEQSILIRKGGIAEGRDGFQFQHREFFLFPTFFHEQAGMTRTPEAKIPARREGEIEIRIFAEVAFAAVVTNWETAVALEPFHILTRDVVQERFEYDEGPGMHVACVRVFHLEPRWMFPDAARYGGCRSWVNLPEPPAGMRRQKIGSDEEHAKRLATLREMLAN